MKKKKIIFKIIFTIIAIIIIALLYSYFRNVIYEIIVAAKNNDKEAIDKIIDSQTFLGHLRIVGIEALQMIAVFFSAEFIQIGAGISFSPWMAILLCDLGVFVGATVIYILVNILKFDGSVFTKNEGRIAKLAQKNKSKGVQTLMYILFVMPVIPIGSICYFGASKKISYRRYILTCVTGVLPDILSGILLGKVLLWCAGKNIPLWLLILCVIVVMIILFTIAMFIINKMYFKNEGGNPYSSLYDNLMKLIGIKIKTKAKVTFDNEKLEGIEGPFVLIGNHASHYDYWYYAKLALPEHLSIVCNRYYFRNKMFRFVFKRLGVIPKKLFNPDIETIKKAMNSIKNDYSINMLPEGRLSIDGTSYDITESTGNLMKKLNVPVVLCNVHGAYLSNPKWKKKRNIGKIKVEVVDVITTDELKELTVQAIDERINEKIKINDFKYARDNNLIYKEKHKAEGLENVLYRCPKCYHEYTIETNQNTIHCMHCNETFELDEHYSFKENSCKLKDIHEWYQWMAEYEKPLLDNNYKLETKVKVKKMNMTNKKEDRIGTGVCTLTNEGITFKGVIDEEVSIHLSIKQLRALAFSCNEEFEFYYENDLYYFYPIDNPKQCVKWALVVDELYKKERNC